jgi:N-sulfoglucosamine sulfohydrolase
MMKPISVFLGIVLIATSVRIHAQDKPNILWITSEDNASHWLGCYGNKQASTPRLDALAAGGLRFTHAYSNAAVCAVARSTILNGAYAVTQGTQHMRSRHEIPADFKPHVSYLRGLGYYCTNNSKTDYNFKGNDAAIWDECSPKAHYKKRPDGKPFFAIFNLTVTHESNLFPEVIRRNRKQGIIPKKPRVDPDSIVIPPSQPDLPEFHNDAAIYHDCVTALDKQVGRLLDELKNAGLAENTIVFYYSDHGGAMARGKRYLEDSGVRIPMIVHLPEKWRHLAPFKPGSAVDEMVAFVDLAPTLLSLCDIEKPTQMQGRPFLGKHRVDAPKDAHVFLFADRFDETDGMRRGITDGRFKYIRCFSPHLPSAPYCDYPLGQASWAAWKKAVEDGKLTGYHYDLWKAQRPTEFLFDTQSDPWEVNNLAALPEQAKRLESMRGKLQQWMIDTKDTSMVPEKMWEGMGEGKTIHGFVRDPSLDHAKVVKLAFAASSAGFDSSLIDSLSSSSPVDRYWAATGCLIHGSKASAAAAKLKEMQEDPSPVVREVAKLALAAVEKN